MGNEEPQIMSSFMGKRIVYLLILAGCLLLLTACSLLDRTLVANLDSLAGRNFACCPLFSHDGNYVTFFSWSSNLVPDDTNEESDVFVFDIAANQLARISYGFDGSQANDGSARSAISSGGRYVAFVSDANNLTAEDHDETRDVFLYSRESGQTIRIPDASELDGFTPTSGRGVSISADGRRIAFLRFFRPPGGEVDAQVFVFDRVLGETHAVSLTAEGHFSNEWAENTSISPDGRFVAFASDATDLTSDDANGHTNLYLHDLASRTTSCITCMPNAPRMDSGPHEWATFSADGRYLAYQSYRYGGIAIFDLEQNSYLPPLDLQCDCRMGNSALSLSLDGRFIAFEARVDRPLTALEALTETWCFESCIDASQSVIVVHDRNTGLTTQIYPAKELTTRSDVDAGHPVISSDGRYVAFDNLVRHSTQDTPQVRDIIIFDRETGKSIVVTAGNGIFKWR
jgi:Tol biopolymer transport system component